VRRPPLRTANKTPVGALSRRAPLLLRRHEATDVLELVAHAPNGAIREVGRIGKSLASTQDLWRPTAICGDLGSVMRVGLIRFHWSPRPPTSACDHKVADILRRGRFGVMLRASQGRP
jgi:hypothetical protein